MSSTIWAAKLRVPVSPQRDHIRGPADAPVMLVEYGDYQCPYCSAAHQVVNAILAEARSGLGFAFRHFPMTTVHPLAEQAAEAAEAAGGQGKFWAMHDTLYENQPRFEEPYLLAYAQALGLDFDQFSSDLAEHRYAAKIAEDFMSGVRSGVSGTPTFFINGVRHDGGWDFASLATAIRSVAAAL
jgi:protein-disulfide isomerase